MAMSRDERLTRRRIRQRERYANDPEFRERCLANRRKQRAKPDFKKKAREYARKKWRTDPELRKRHAALATRKRLQYRYGISDEEHQQLKRSQNHRCAICRKRKTLVVDHCHKTGCIRGLLCNGCNGGPGKLGDTVASVTKALQYLKKKPQ